MPIADSILAELQEEAKTTRRVLERIPEDKLGWKPHVKSMTLGELAWHVATTPGEIARVAAPEAYDWSGEESVQAPSNKSEIVDKFESSLSEAKAYLSQLDDSSATAIWKLTIGGKEILSMPRIAFIRSVMLNHSYHHRGQLSVYLRLLDVPVPAMYGGSADEKALS